MAKKERLDQILVKLSLVESRSKAQALIMAGNVRLEGQVARKAGQKVALDAQIQVVKSLPYVSRGGLKLEGALNEFGYDPTNQCCADVGACTGGFTDLLLQRGAKKVYAIDVGYGQLAWKLRQDSRVVVIERTNARYLKRLEDPIDLVVMDVSFISIRLLLPVLAQWLAPKGHVITLVKPQFEAGRQDVGPSGVIRDPRIHRKVLQNIVDYATTHNWQVHDATVSPIHGQRGNQEFFLWLSPGAAKKQHDVVKQALQRAAMMKNK